MPTSVNLPKLRPDLVAAAFPGASHPKRTAVRNGVSSRICVLHLHVIFLLLLLLFFNNNWHPAGRVVI